MIMTTSEEYIAFPNTREHLPKILKVSLLTPSTIFRNQQENYSKLVSAQSPFSQNEKGVTLCFRKLVNLIRVYLGISEWNLGCREVDRSFLEGNHGGKSTGACFPPATPLHQTEVTEGREGHWGWDVLDHPYPKFLPQGNFSPSQCEQLTLLRPWSDSRGCCGGGVGGSTSIGMWLKLSLLSRTLENQEEKMLKTKRFLRGCRA